MENLEKYLEKNKNKFDDLLLFTGSLFFSNKLILRKLQRTFGDEILISDNALYKVLLPLYNHVLNQKIEHNGKPYLILDFFPQEKKIEIANSLDFKDDFNYFYFYEPFTKGILEVDFSNKNNKEILVIFYKHLLLFIFKNCRITVNKLKLKENFEDFLDKEKKFNEKFPEKNLIDGFIKKSEKKPEIKKEKKEKKHEFLTYEKIDNLEKILKKKILFQKEGVDGVLNILRNKVVNVNKDLNLANFILFGSSGVGKSETVKILSEELDFDLLKLNLGNYHSNEISSIVGVGAGFEQSSSSSLLEGFFKKDKNNEKGKIIFFDEIDKVKLNSGSSINQIYDFFESLMEKEIVLKNGKNLDFSNTILVFGTNGNDQNSLISKKDEKIGFEIEEGDEEKFSYKKYKEKNKEIYYNNLPFSFIGRLDYNGFIVYKPFLEDEIDMIFENSSKKIFGLINSKLENKLDNFKEVFDVILDKKDEVLEEIEVEKYGIRLLNKALEYHIKQEFFKPTEKFKKTLKKRLI